MPAAVFNYLCSEDGWMAYTTMVFDAIQGKGKVIDYMKSAKGA